MLCQLHIQLGQVVEPVSAVPVAIESSRFQGHPYRNPLTRYVSLCAFRCQCQLGNTSLHYAAQNGHEEMCQVLIRAGVDRNAHTKVNRTPLHLAAQEGHLPIVQLFVAHGADLHAIDMVNLHTFTETLIMFVKTRDVSALRNTSVYLVLIGKK